MIGLIPPIRMKKIISGMAETIFDVKRAVEKISTKQTTDLNPVGLKRMNKFSIGTGHENIFVDFKARRVLDTKSIHFLPKKVINW